MSTNWKPDDSKLIGTKKECKDYIFLSNVNDNPNGLSYGVWSNLFDGHSMGLYTGQYDMKIKFNKYVNIYGINTYELGKSDIDINDENGNLLNYKYKTDYNDCYNKWVLLFKNIKPGTYIFNSKLPFSSRDTLISEWFIEQALDNTHLIKINNKYYCLKPDTYDTINKCFIEIYITQGNTLIDLFIKNQVNLSDLSKDVIFNNETFKPISKFENFSITKLSLG